MAGDESLPCRIVFGGFHGDEPKSVDLAGRLIELLRASQHDETGQDEANAAVGYNPADLRWVVFPVVNPDGLDIRNRRNARKVDINRNFPTENFEVGIRRSRMFGGSAPASEPETRAVIKLVERCRPASIITIHSISGNRFCNNYDGPGKTLAAAMKRRNGYPVVPSIGYPTPGSFGAWAGLERNIPTITLELPSHHSGKRCWADNRNALLCRA